MLTVLRTKCPECGIIARSVGQEKVWNYVDNKTYTVIHLYCRHELIAEGFSPFRFDVLKTKDGDRLYPFQARACDFGQEANLRVLYTLEMGLGKTVIADSLVKAYHNKIAPILIVCKSSLTIQWLMETFKWSNRIACIMENGKEKPHFDFFSIFICSMDLLRRSSWAKDTDVVFKTIIIDEVQHIKNPNSQRTKLIRQLCARADNVIGLSGTPIKNHAAEYFTILNILHPELFPSESNFISNWVESYWDAESQKLRYGGIKYWKRFQELTGDFILRMTREEVMPEIPKVQRTFMFCDLGDELTKMYDESVSKFKAAWEEKDIGVNKWEAGAALQESMNEMRQVIGLAKVKPTVEYIREFLENWSNGSKRKLVVFAHHIRAADLLEDALNEMMPEFNCLPVLRMKGGMKAQTNYDMEQEFKSNPLRRVLVASTLAAGEGKNFQFCSDAVLMERQWNPANEEQAEARFTRIGSTADFVGVKYIVARKTFDEVMAKLVEKKRQFVTQSLSGEKVKWQESNFMMELMKLVYEGKAA